MVYHRWHCPPFLFPSLKIVVTIQILRVILLVVNISTLILIILIFKFFVDPFVQFLFDFNFILQPKFMIYYFLLIWSLSFLFLIIFLCSFAKLLFIFNFILKFQFVIYFFVQFDPHFFLLFLYLLLNWYFFSISPFNQKFIIALYFIFLF